MSAIKNISLFIPHVFPNFDENFVAGVFDYYGKVDHVDLIGKYDRNGKFFNSAYIHFKYWHEASQNIQKRILKNEEVHIYYDGPWFWIVLANNTKKHITGERKVKIDLGDEKVISVSNLKTPEKHMAKKIDTPNAPEKPKSYAEAVGINSLFVEKPVLRRSTAVDFPSSVDATEELINSEYPLNDILSELPNENCEEKEREEDYLCTLFKKVDDDREMDEIDTELAGDEKYCFDKVDAEMDEIEEQMDEIESGLKAEDTNLVSIDWRYVQTIERENTWLNCEVAQLRSAIINLHQLYQVEAAKVSALSIPFVNVIQGDENV
jgi:hypothetical protein